MREHDPYSVHRLDNIENDSRVIHMVVTKSSNDTVVIELHHGSRVVSSAKFGLLSGSQARDLLIDLKRLREGTKDKGTLPELARYLRHDALGDELVLVLNRLADDFGMPVDHFVVKARRWLPADDFRCILDVLPEDSQKYLISKAHSAIKHGDLHDEEIVELVNTFRHKHKSEPLKDEQPTKKKRRFFGRR